MEVPAEHQIHPTPGDEFQKLVERLDDIPAMALRRDQRVVKHQHAETSGRACQPLVRPLEFFPRDAALRPVEIGTEGLAAIHAHHMQARGGVDRFDLTAEGRAIPLEGGEEPVEGLVECGDVVVARDHQPWPGKALHEVTGIGQLAAPGAHCQIAAQYGEIG